MFKNFLKVFELITSYLDIHNYQFDIIFVIRTVFNAQNRCQFRRFISSDHCFKSGEQENAAGARYDEYIERGSISQLNSCNFGIVFINL